MLHQAANRRLERVVEESERTVTAQGNEPEGEFGHFHGHRIDVHTVEATVSHIATGNSDALGEISRDESLSGITGRKISLLVS